MPKSGGPRLDPSRTLKLSDGSSLQLWIQTTGSKLWNLAYCFAGNQKKLALGPCPAVGLREARNRREEAKRLLLEGIDPGQEKKNARLVAATKSQDTFASLSAELIEKKRREDKAEADLSPDCPRSACHLRKVEARGRLETARRMRSVIGEVFR